MNHFRTRSPFRKILILGVLCVSMLALAAMNAPWLLAQNASDGDTQESSESNTTNSLRERIDRIVEEQKDTVRSALNNAPSQRRGFIGQVARVSETTITLHYKNATRVVPLEGVELMRGAAQIAPETIEVDNWALVLGLASDDSFVPKKITFLTVSPRPKSHVVYLGSLKNIKVRSLDFQPRGQDVILTLTLNNTTQYQDDQGEPAALADFVSDDQVLLIGYEDDTGLFVTTMRALAPLGGN